MAHYFQQRDHAFPGNLTLGNTTETVKIGDVRLTQMLQRNPAFKRKYGTAVPVFFMMCN